MSTQNSPSKFVLAAKRNALHQMLKNRYHGPSYYIYSHEHNQVLSIYSVDIVPSPKFIANVKEYKLYFTLKLPSLSFIGTEDKLLSLLYSYDEIVERFPEYLI